MKFRKFHKNKQLNVAKNPQENSTMSLYYWTPQIYYQNNLYKCLNHDKSLKPIS